MSGALRAVVVGCGRAGFGYDQMPGGSPLSHAGAYAAHPEVTLVGGIDPDPAARGLFAERWGVPAHGALDVLPELEPDLVSIATPPAGRGAVVAAVLASRPKAIWIEKPLACDVSQGEEIVAACEMAGVSLQVNFQRRFDPLHRELADAVRASASPIHVQISYSRDLEGFAAHALDLARWLGGEVRGVHALAVAGGEPLVLLRCAAATTGLIVHTPTVRGVDVFDLDVRTPTHRFAVSAVGEQMVTARVEPSLHFAPVEVHSFQPAARRDGLGDAMLGAVSSLLACVRSGAAPLCGGQDGVAALRLLHAIRHSAASGMPIELSGA